VQQDNEYSIHKLISCYKKDLLEIANAHAFRVTHKDRFQCSDAVYVHIKLFPALYMHSDIIRYEMGHDIHDMSNDRFVRDTGGGTTIHL